MGDFTEPNAEQKALCREVNIDPAGYVVILDNERLLVMLHLKSRNEVTIHKNRRVKNGSK